MYKYPRTLHFQFSPEIHSDDKVIHLKDLGNFISQEYIIGEKLDGQNNCLKGFLNFLKKFGGVFARSHAQETKLPWDTYIINWYHSYKYSLLNDHAYFIENLFAEHSIVYENLDSYMFLFNIVDLESNMFLSWDDIEAEANRLSLKTPEVLYRGKFNSMAEVKEWMDREIHKPSKYGSQREGFVMRPVNAFPVEDFQKVVGKYVRQGHVQTDEHWTKNWKQATLKK
jgi:hypothetical protein